MVDNNLVLVRLLHIHGADINRWDSVDIFLARYLQYLQYLHREDSDTWSPLHAAAANGHHEIVSYLLAHGADRHKVTEDGERAEDLVEDEDWATLAVFADTKEQLEQEKLRRLSAVAVVDGRGQEPRREPAWVRRMSLQEARKEVGGAAGQEKETADTRRKGSAWVGKEEIVEEEESDDTPDPEEVVPPAKPPRVAAPPASVPPRSLATTTIIVSKERDTEAATATARSQPRQRRRGRLEGEGVGSQFLSVSADKVKTPPSRPSTLASKPSAPTSTSASKPSTPSISVSTPSSTSSTTSFLTPATSGAVAAAKQRFIVAASAGTETVAVKVSENVSSSSSSSSSSVTAASTSSSTSSSSSAKFGKIKFSETSDKISTTACVTGTSKER